MSKDPELRQMLADAETSIMQAKALASKFIVFSKGGLLSKKKVEAEDFLKTTLASIAREKGIPYTLKIENVPRIIEIDPQQLKEALKSVVVNAHESMAKKDAVTILFNAHPVKADVVVISVLDQGKGIEKENIERVFDPYYSTKPLGKDKGTGLGMSIAYSIIKSHQGEILMTSTLNQGTKVDIVLPVYQKEEFLQMDKIVSDQTAPDREKNSQRVKVLIMDDDQMIREISAKILIKLGYAPIVAKDGEQAVQFFQQHLKKGEAINFAILDLEVKQGMGGAEAIKKLLPLNPDLKAIIASGYSSDKIMENCQDYGFAMALSKPFTMNTLKEALAQLQ
jgi:CheY-like chemotaxis protein/anti-sigma regulatory factor (Ser/Thr protein kinase)